MYLISYYYRNIFPFLFSSSMLRIIRVYLWSYKNRKKKQNKTVLMHGALSLFLTFIKRIYPSLFYFMFFFVFLLFKRNFAYLFFRCLISLYRFVCINRLFFFVFILKIYLKFPCWLARIKQNLHMITFSKSAALINNNIQNKR